MARPAHSGGSCPPVATPASSRIPEIDGLRGVAIALIVIYHIWLNRVSGGVDVFLLLSGFLITASLLRTVERQGRVGFLAFYARIARRLFPPALAVLVGVIVAAVLFLPQTRWRETLEEVVAASLYVVNWHLANNAVDYLASQNAASPVQHYWSLAIQGQFYLVWPVAIAIAALVATRVAGRLRPALALLFGAVFASSLAYSMHRTVVDQVYTYFDTFARMWEFALGGLLLLALPFLRRLPRAAMIPLGWLGLAALVACGMVFRNGNEFPGWAALWPTLAASLLILTAGTGSVVGADRLLRSRPLSRLGDLSYALYLWHWPVLICYFAVSGNSRAGLRGGLAVIVVSVALAVVTRWLLELRLPATRLGQRTNRGGFALAAVSVVAVLASAGLWQGYMSWQHRTQAEADARNYPGAAYLAHGGDLPDVAYRPGVLDAKDDRAEVYDTGCHQSPDDPDVLTCEFGPAAADVTIALVGGSHSAHWLPALQELAEPNRWRIVSITKSACRFSDRGPEAERTSCTLWNEQVIPVLADLRPDLVITTSTVVNRGPEQTPEGYLTHWRTLDSLSIPVLAIRDTPRPGFDIPECVERHGAGSPECDVPRAEYGLDRPAEVSERTDLPRNVALVDFTDYVCDPVVCPAVVGNVLVYHDGSHLSATYARTLAPFLEEAVGRALQRS